MRMTGRFLSTGLLLLAVLPVATTFAQTGAASLTGAATVPDAWRRFFEPADRVGIKVNCGGYPYCISAYEIVADVTATTRPGYGPGMPGVADGL